MDHATWGQQTCFPELLYGLDYLRLEDADPDETAEMEWLKKRQKAIEEGRREPEREPPKKGPREQRQ